MCFLHIALFSHRNTLIIHFKYSQYTEYDCVVFFSPVPFLAYYNWLVAWISRYKSLAFCLYIFHPLILQSFLFIINVTLPSKLSTAVSVSLNFCHQCCLTGNEEQLEKQQIPLLAHLSLLLCGLLQIINHDVKTKKFSVHPTILELIFFVFFH